MQASTQADRSTDNQTATRIESTMEPTADARTIPALAHDEAAALATTELGRFLALLDVLSPEDWARPTACPRWDVRQVVAHVAGAAAAYAGWAEFRRQGSPRTQRPYRAAGLPMLDALNQVQVDDRATTTPDALIAELRQVGPCAIATRRRLPAPLRALRLPLPLLGIVRLDYLTDTIYTRDMWMHRLDLCRATGREMASTPGHDGRIVALVVRDLAQKLPRDVRAGLVYELTGPAGGVWRLGGDSQGEAARVRLDALAFALLAAGRLMPEEARAGATIDGDAARGARALSRTTVPF